MITFDNVINITVGFKHITENSTDYCRVPRTFANQKYNNKWVVSAWLQAGSFRELFTLFNIVNSTVKSR